MAIAALILSILGFCTIGLTGLIGLILGIVSLVSLNAAGAHGPVKGRGAAIAAIVLGSLSLIVTPILVLMLAIMLPAVAKARDAAREMKASTQAAQVARAIATHVTASADGALIDAQQWDTILIDQNYITPELLLHPERPEAGPFLAMNEALDEMKISEIVDPANTILLFETRPGSPLFGGPELLPSDPRERLIVVFVDGHVEILSPEEATLSNWMPFPAGGH